MEKIGKIAVGISVVIVLASIGGYITGIIYAVRFDYKVKRDTVAWLSRAQVAGDLEDMEEYILNCMDGMEKWGVIEGNADPIFPTASNDFDLIYKALNRTVIRCDEIYTTYNKTSQEYQTALDDIRGQLRELDLHLPEGWWWQSAGSLALVSYAWLGWIGILITGKVCSIIYDKYDRW